MIHFVKSCRDVFNRPSNYFVSCNVLFSSVVPPWSPPPSHPLPHLAPFRKPSESLRLEATKKRQIVEWLNSLSPVSHFWKALPVPTPPPKPTLCIPPLTQSYSCESVTGSAMRKTMCVFFFKYRVYQTAPRSRLPPKASGEGSRLGLWVWPPSMAVVLKQQQHSLLTFVFKKCIRPLLMISPHFIEA